MKKYYCLLLLMFPLFFSWTYMGKKTTNIPDEHRFKKVVLFLMKERVAMLVGDLILTPMAIYTSLLVTIPIPLVPTMHPLTTGVTGRIIMRSVPQGTQKI
jgi:hypothetical protein